MPCQVSGQRHLAPGKSGFQPWQLNSRVHALISHGVSNIKLQYEQAHQAWSLLKGYPLNSKTERLSLKKKKKSSTAHNLQDPQYKNDSERLV